MNDVKDGGPAAYTAMRWALRRHGWLVALCGVQLAVLAPLLAMQQPVTYESTALVVARQVELAPQAVPRFATTVFESGAVARAVAADPLIGGEPESLIPGRLDVDAPQDNAAFEVTGRDANPELAAHIANVAALEFVGMLNRPGAGVGSFGLQQAATVPTEPAASGLGAPMLAAVGLVAGLMLGFGLLLLLVAVRRPAVTAVEVEQILDVPATGPVTVPKFGRSEFFGPRRVPGLAGVVRAVLEAPAPTVLLAGPPEVEAVRRRVAVMVALGVHRHRRVGMDGDVELAEVLATAGADLDAQAHRPPSPNGGITLIDGAGPLDHLAGRAVTLLVVPEGVPRERLRAMAAEYLLDELCRVVLVRSGPRKLAARMDRIDSTGRVPETHVVPDRVRYGDGPASVVGAAPGISVRSAGAGASGDRGDAR